MFFFRSAAIKNSPHVVQGAVSTGHQYHFHMETQVTHFLLFFPAKYYWLPAVHRHGAATYFILMFSAMPCDLTKSNAIIM